MDLFTQINTVGAAWISVCCPQMLTVAAREPTTIKPPTFQLVYDLLYILNHSHPNQHMINGPNHAARKIVKVLIDNHGASP